MKIYEQKITFNETKTDNNIQTSLLHTSQKEIVTGSAKIKTPANQDLVAEQEEYQALVNTIAWTEGFGSVFIRCSPAKGDEIIQRVRQDLPQKKIEVLKLEPATYNLHDLVASSDIYHKSDVLFIKNIELLLYEYEAQYAETKLKDVKERYSYSWKGVPPILRHLNQQRENFRDNFKICFVFLLPLFALKYFIRRAPDFFDWRSGVLEFAPSSEFLRQESTRIVLEADYQKYLVLPQEKRKEEIGKIQSFLAEENLPPQRKAELLLEQASIYKADNNYEYASSAYKNAINYCNQSISVNPESYEAWRDKSSALIGLGQYEEAVASSTKAIQNISDNYQAWNNKGTAHYYLTQYEEALICIEHAIKGKPRLNERKNNYELLHSQGAILYSLECYDKALDSFRKTITYKPDYHSAWHSQSFTLYNLGRYEEAIISFNKVLSLYKQILEIKPHYEVLISKSQILHALSLNNKALAILDEAIELNPNLPNAWVSRGHVLQELERYEEALNSYDKAIANYDQAIEWSLNDYALALVSRANVLTYLKRDEESLKTLDEAITIQPNNPDVWQAWTNTLVSLGRYEEAITGFNKALQLKSDHYWSWFGLGNVLHDLGRNEEANESYAKAIECNPKDPDFWNSWGEILYYRGHNEDALVNFEKAIQFRKPGYYIPFYNQGNVLSDLERYNEAIASYDKVIEIKSDHYWAWYHQGNALRQLNREEEAHRNYQISYQKAKACEANDPDFWNSWGNTQYELSRYNKALDGYNIAIQLKPNYYWAWLNRGHTLRVLKELEDARASYVKASENPSSEQDFWYSLGYAWFEMGSFRNSLNIFEKITKINNYDYEAWSNKSAILTFLNDHEEAIKNLKKALEIKPNNHELWNRMGNSLYQLSRYQEAFDSYNKAVELKPDYCWGWYNRGNTLRQLGRLEDAHASYVKTLECKSDDPDLWNSLGDTLFELNLNKEALTSFNKLVVNQNDSIILMKRAAVLAKLGHTQEALTEYDKAVVAQPDNYELWTSRGALLFSLGLYEEAIKSLKRVVGLKPESYETWDIIGKILYELGRYEEALDYHTKAVELEPDYCWGWYNRGNTLRQLERLEDARASYLKGFKCQSDDPNFWNSLGDAFFELDLHHEALASCDKALAAQPDNHEVYVYQAGILFSLDLYEQAIVSLKKAIEIKPESYEVWQMIGNVQKETGQTEEAIDSYKKSFNYQQTNSELKVALLCSSTVAFPSIDALLGAKALVGLGMPPTLNDNFLRIQLIAQANNTPFVAVNPEDIEVTLASWLSTCHPDVVFMVGFPYKISSSIFSIPRLGFLNFHLGLLPAYRGPDPVFWEIRNREKQGGITVHLIDEKFNNGPIVHIEEVPILKDDTYGQHMQKLALATRNSTEKIIELLRETPNQLPMQPQNSKHSHYYKRPDLSNLLIDWSIYGAYEIEALVRATNPTYGGALSFIRGVPIHILQVEPLPEKLESIQNLIDVDITNATPGTIVLVNSRGIVVVCKNKELLRLEITYTEDGFFTAGKLVDQFSIKSGEMLTLPPQS